MRLKENRDNWKASNVIRKTSELAEPKPKAAKKNTRLWCKGKMGREHDVYLIKSEILYWPKAWRWLTGQCKTCKKEWNTSLRRERIV